MAFHFAVVVTVLNTHVQKNVDKDDLNLHGEGYALSSAFHFNSTWLHIDIIIIHRFQPLQQGGVTANLCNGHYGCYNYMQFLAARSLCTYFPAASPLAIWLHITNKRLHTSLICGTNNYFMLPLNRNNYILGMIVLIIIGTLKVLTLPHRYHFLLKVLCYLLKGYHLPCRAL